MSNPASSDDVEARWRPLSDDLRSLVSIRLDDAWRKLRRLVPDIETRMESDQDLTDEAVQVVADSVIRLLENPQGAFRGSVTLDDRTKSWEIRDSLAKGELFFTDAELDGLRATPVVTRSIFSIIPC